MEQERPIRVVIAEDQRLTRETLARKVRGMLGT